MTYTMLLPIKLTFLLFIGLDDRLRSSLAAVPNALKGQHLLIIWPRWEGNPKGLSGPLKGGVIIDYLSERFGFTYEMVRIKENRLEPTPNQKGLFNYLWDRECHLIVSSIVPTLQRTKVVDLTVPWEYSRLALLIPVHGETANIESVVKPFQWPVWIGLIVTAVCVIVVLNLIQRYLEYMEHRSGFATKQRRDLPGQNGQNGLAARQYIYVLGNLLSQGGPCTSNRLSFRFVAGVWTVAAFIFVQAYTSTLFTYVVAPVNKPLINSVYDIADNPDIQLLVKKGGTPENMFTNSNQTGFYEKIRDRINSFPDSRCVLVSDCIKLVTPGSNNVFIDAEVYQWDAIQADFKESGKCNLELAKETYTTLIITMALSKNSPYTNSISKGLLELQEHGLINHWDLWFRPMSGPCMKNGKGSGFKSQGRKKHPPLSLKNLTGAFLVLSVGVSLAVLAFLCEKLIPFFGRLRFCQHN